MQHLSLTRMGSSPWMCSVMASPPGRGSKPHRVQWEQAWVQPGWHPQQLLPLPGLISLYQSKLPKHPSESPTWSKHCWKCVLQKRYYWQCLKKYMHTTVKKVHWNAPKCLILSAPKTWLELAFVWSLDLRTICVPAVGTVQLQARGRRVSHPKMQEVKVGAGRSLVPAPGQGRARRRGAGAMGLGLAATRTNTRQQGLRSPDDEQ